MYHWRRCESHLLGFAFALVALPTVALAQTGGQPAAQADSVCAIPGKPLPTCQGFGIFEFGYGYRLGERPSWSKENIYFIWELGGLSNVTNRVALGLSLFAGVDLSSYRFGLKSRNRLWLSEYVGLDFSAGLFVFSDHERFAVNNPGFTAHVGLNFADWFQPMVQLDVLRLGSYGTDVAWYAGARAGSYAAVAGTVGLAVVVAATLWAAGQMLSNP